MVQTTTFGRRTDSSANYATFDAQDNSFKGFYLTKEIAEQVGEFIEVTLDGEEGLELQYNGSTTATHKYGTTSDTVKVIYVDPSVVEVPADEQPPETLRLQVKQASEEAFEEEEEARLEEDAGALIA